MSINKFQIKIVFICFLVLIGLKSSFLNAKCSCECVGSEVKVVCKGISDIKPVCMPFSCKKTSISEVQKIDPPIPALGTKKRCKISEKIDLNNREVLLKEDCQ